VTATDVAIAGNVSVQMQNPNGTKSNAVSLVVAPPNPSDEVIALSSSAPGATGKDTALFPDARVAGAQPAAAGPLQRVHECDSPAL
jgi:hypothetical protein